MSKSSVSTVAIIDSGIGGVSVLKRLISKFGCGNYIYFADNLYMPYGSKSKKFVFKRIQELIKLMQNSYNANLVIIACNTASSVVNKLNLKNVICMQFHKEYSYLATPLTSKALTGCTVIKDKSLANEIELHIERNSKLEDIIKKHVKKHSLDELDSLVLGCTHYELVERYFKKYCPNTDIICNSQFIMQEIEVEHNELNVIFLTSKQSDEYIKKLNYALRSWLCVVFMVTWGKETHIMLW